MRSCRKSSNSARTTTDGADFGSTIGRLKNRRGHLGGFFVSADSLVATVRTLKPMADHENLSSHERGQGNTRALLPKSVGLSRTLGGTETGVPKEPQRRTAMRNAGWASALLMSAAIASSPAWANEDVIKQTADPNQWVLQSGDYANTRYSKLDQINTRQRRLDGGRVDILDRRAARPRRRAAGHRQHDVHPHAVSRISCMRSTSTMTEDRFGIFAQAGSLRHSGNVLRHRQPRRAYADGKILRAGRQQRSWLSMPRRARKCGKPATVIRRRARPEPAPLLLVKDKVIVGISGAEFGVRGHVTAYDIADRQAGLARLFDRAGQRNAGRSGKNHVARQADRQGQLAENLERATSGRSVAARPGAGTPTTRPEPLLLRHRQSLDVEPGSACRS